MSPVYSFAWIFLILQCTNILAQPAASPAPSGPTNITRILEKAGQFTTLIRLMKQSSVASQIDGQLNNSNSGLTMFAPTDSAFSSLPSGTLNSLNDQQKVALVQFHIVPTFLSGSQFQTVSNPLRTQAGGTDNGEFPLNITTSGTQVNVSTGVDSTPISGTVYTDNQLAIYQVDKVLLPLSLFGPAAPAPSPSPGSDGKSKKKKSLASGPSAGGDVPADASGAVGTALHGMVACLVSGVVFTSVWL